MSIYMQNQMERDTFIVLSKTYPQKENLQPSVAYCEIEVGEPGTEDNEENTVNRDVESLDDLPGTQEFHSSCTSSISSLSNDQAGGFSITDTPDIMSLGRFSPDTKSSYEAPI
ncbi:hypothetical protein ABEB36_005857 [Hypothenemus hampei]|uniref:Uncharacterized protein n=1 Tax=Hypothenemus hampei TaxID=57062 RepID=A0ABD1F0B3_HYPHA